MSTNNIGFVIISILSLAFHGLYQSKGLKPKLMFLLCIIILCLAALLTQSRAAFIGLLIAMIILCFNNKKIVFPLMAVLLLIVIMPGIKDRLLDEGFTTDNRVKISHLTWEVIKDHPIIGIGFGMQIYQNESLLNLKEYNSRLPKKFQQAVIMPSPHNTFMDIALRTGIVGLILHLHILLTAVFLLWKTYRNAVNEYVKSWAICLFACFAASTVASLFQDTTFGARAVNQYAILAMITILWKLSSNTMDHKEI